MKICGIWDTVSLFMFSSLSPSELECKLCRSNIIVIVFIRRKSISLVISQKSVLKLKQYLYHWPLGDLLCAFLLEDLLSTNHWSVAPIWRFGLAPISLKRNVLLSINRDRPSFWIGTHYIQKIKTGRDLDIHVTANRWSFLVGWALWKRHEVDLGIWWWLNRSEEN